MDFAKAFDSVDREGLWRRLQHYGVPTNVVNVIKGTYMHNKVRAQVRALLFLVEIDWIIREALENEKNGIQ